MADNHELHSPAVQRTLDDLDDAVETLSDLIAEHERSDHGGEACVNERMNMVAWVAHRIGWNPHGIVGLIELEHRIEAYTRHHDAWHRHGLVKDRAARR